MVKIYYCHVSHITSPKHMYAFLSPQTYHQMHGGHSIVPGNQVTMHLPFQRIHIHVDPVRNNLPVVHNSFVTEHQKREISPQIRSLLA